MFQPDLAHSTMLTYEQARRTVIEQAQKPIRPRTTAAISVWDALGYVLAQDVKTDRPYPAFDRSTRDGFALRAQEAVPGAKLPCVGEIKPRDSDTPPRHPATCLPIFTA